MKRRMAIAICPLLSAIAIFSAPGPESDKSLLVIVENGRYGFIDHDGKILIRPQFLWADDFINGFGSVFVCGRYLSIDSSGMLLPLKEHYASCQLQLMEREGKIGFVDAAGKFRVEPIYDEALPFSGGYAAVRVANKWGFVDTAGRMIIHPKFSEAYYFREGVATAAVDSGYVLINLSGEVIAHGYKFLQGIVNQGRVPASAMGKSGYLDLQGKIAIPFIYESVETFTEGLAAVEKEGKWGYIDRNGNTVIPFQFDRAGNFGNGLAPVIMGETSGFIDKLGKFAFLLAFRQAPGFLTDDEKGTFIAPHDVSRFWTKDNRFGYVNTVGRVIWGPVFGSPDHTPLLGWTEEDKIRSCEGIPEATKNRILGFPE